MSGRIALRLADGNIAFVSTTWWREFLDRLEPKECLTQSTSTVLTSHRRGTGTNVEVESVRQA